MQIIRKVLGHWRGMFGVIISLLAVALVLSNRDALFDSLNSIREANFTFIVFSFVAFSLTVFSASAMAFVLSLRRPASYNRLLLAQTATLFIGKLVPSGIGSIATMARALIVKGHTVIEAGAVMTMIGLATFVGNVLMSLLSLSFGSININLDGSNFSKLFLIAPVALMLAISLVWIWPRARKKVINVIKEMKEVFTKYKSYKLNLLYAVIFGAMVTLGFALALKFSASSLGVQISVLAAIITVSIGSLGVAVTPLPGGALGAEAALALSLTQFGVGTEVALAIALLYRLITFWIPLLPGFVSSQYMLKRRYL